MKKEEVNKQIKEVVRPNGKGEINGNNLQETLLLMNNNAANDEDITSKLSLKANQKETDEKLSLKADKEDTYTKTEANALLDKKLNVSDYEKDKEADKSNNEKQDIELSKTKQEIDSIKQSLQGIGEGVVGTAEGGGVINLPSRAVSSVTPRYKVEGLTMQNLVKNGNFSDKMKGWRFHNTSGEINSDDNVVMWGGRNLVVLRYFDGTSGILACKRRFKIISGNCVKAVIQTAGGSHNFVIDNPSKGVWIDNTIITNTTIRDGGSLEYKFIFEDDTVENKVEVDYVIVLNLTQTFGAGNEPTKEWCDEHISGYFEGTKSVTAPLRIKSVAKDNSNESSLYINNNLELKSVGEVKDYIENGKLYKYISDDGEILEETEVIDLNKSGLITANPNGTVFFEPITNLTGFYDDGLNVEGLDILEVEEFSHLINGVYQSLDVSKVKIEGGKLTHPDVHNGIVYLVYRYDNNAVWGKNTISYYNSDKTLKSPNGKIWKKVETATDTGELVVALEEVKEEIVEPLKEEE